MSDKKTDDRPISYRIALWHGYIISGIFLLYGGVQIVLSILDRNFVTMGQMILFAALGLILLMVVLMYAERKKIGWYGLILINIIIIILALIGYSQYENLILLVLSAISLYMLYSEKTKNYLYKLR